MTYDSSDSSREGLLEDHYGRRRFLQGVIAGSALATQTTAARAGGDPADDTNTNARPAGDPPEIAWQETYGGSAGEWANSVIETSEGGYLFAGTTGSFGSGGRDAWLVKVDARGAVQWERTYEGSDPRVSSVIESSEGGYLFAGMTLSGRSDRWDAWLVKVDSEGMVRWKNTYGGYEDDWVASVIESSDGGYLFAGETIVDLLDADGQPAWLVKVDSSGAVQWEETYGGDWAQSTIESSDGGYLVAGSGDTDVWLVKVDAAGAVQWEQTYGGSDDDRAQSIIESSEGDYLVAGWTESSGSGGGDAWLVKVDSAGAIQWKQTYEGSDPRVSSVIESSGGGYLLAGYTESGGSDSSDAWLVKVDSSGVVQWEQTYGGSDDEQANSVIESSEGGYLVAGETKSSGSGGQDAWLVKLEGERSTPDEGSTPIAAFTVDPDEPTAGETVTFDASDSAVAGGGGTIAEYRWDFDGDGTLDATGETVTHSYDDPGEYTVTLTVVATDGTEATTRDTLTIVSESQGAETTTAGETTQSPTTTTARTTAPAGGGESGNDEADDATTGADGGSSGLPGLGIVSGLAGLGATGYLLRRRSDSDSDDG